MEKRDIHEMSNFEYTPQGIEELKTLLKEGKTVRNPFAKFYRENVEVTVRQDSETAQTLT
ncbi:MAG: hypothetical protein FWH17_04280 [Oscillospiraceae bacterium]|nr:hypothetical protein [Oscillospiraceae bacterium]